MTKKQIEEVLQEEILKCELLTTDEDGAPIHAHYPQESGTYQDGLIFALNLLKKVYY